MPHILFICTANICRSPVAEALLKEALKERGLDSYTVASAGTWAQQKRGASRYSIRVMADQGLEIGEHRARMVDNQMLREADLVLCMESNHMEALRAEFPAHGRKIHMITEMIDKRYSISDPYGGSLQEYQVMADDLSVIIHNGLDRIIALAEENAA